MNVSEGLRHVATVVRFSTGSVILGAALAAGVVAAQPPSPAPAGTPGGQQSPLLVEKQTASDTPAESARTAARNPDDTNIWIAGATIAIAVIAFFQLIVFGIQARVFWIQAKRLRETVEVSERTSMPYLLPVAREIPPNFLLPSGDAEGHTPSIAVIFDNYGKSPAIINEIQVRLWLGDLPESPEFDDHATVDRHQIVIPGETYFSRGGIGQFQGTICRLERPIARNEIEQVRRRESEGPIIRFFVFGYVSYDDFFENRHTQWFCLKVFPGGGQWIIGGRAFNHVERRKIPQSEDIEQSI